MPLSRFGHKAGHGRWGWSGRESSSLTGWNYPSQVVASVTVLCCLPSYHLSSTHQALPFGKLPGRNSYSAPEVGPDWLKPSVPSIPLVHDWFREGHMTQLRPRRGGEMFAGGGGFLGKGSILPQCGHMPKQQLCQPGGGGRREAAGREASRWEWRLQDQARSLFQSKLKRGCGQNGWGPEAETLGPGPQPTQGFSPGGRKTQGSWEADRPGFKPQSLYLLLQVPSAP